MNLLDKKMKIPEPIFKKDLRNISWQKIYEREYGVQYSEAAVSLLAFAGYHFPKTSLKQVVVPGIGHNTIFYIDSKSWIQLVEGLNKKYTSNIKNLKAYEKQFLVDGNNYLKTTQKIAKTNFNKLSNRKILSLFLDHQDKKNRYSVFAWSAFILNNYIADKATKILDVYIKKYKREDEKQNIYDSLFAPEKRAAVLQLQDKVEKYKGKLTKTQFKNLYNRFKWLSCLDIQNNPWTEKEFKKHITLFSSPLKKQIPFLRIIKEFKFNKKDLEYLRMAKRFVYIKDARDDFRRESVYYARNLFEEIGKRMGIPTADTTFLQEQKIINFLLGKKIDFTIVEKRKKGFIVYIDNHKKLVCLQGSQIKDALRLLKLQIEKEKHTELVGRVASKGPAKGVVAIVLGVKDLHKVKIGNILVAVTTHPDYVPVMKKAAAIITDEGGITSHAAIVSREFGIPCIVGCKNATQLLKDGDLIEINAIDGKIIKL